MALNRIYLMKYHNYYSRKVDYATTVAQLITLGASTIKVINDYNFKLNNGLTTSIIINDVDAIQDCDYVVVNDNGGTTRSKILSRWYVMSITKTREGQHQLNLQRDVIPDFWGQIYDKDMMISRCLLPENNKYILNKENLSFNQIKKNEILLKDKSKCGWLVGYLPAKCASETQEITAYTDNNSALTDFTFGTINDFTYKTIAHPFNNNVQFIKRGDNIIIIDFRLQDRDNSNIENYYRFIYSEDGRKTIKDDTRAATGGVSIIKIINDLPRFTNLYQISFSDTTAVYKITKKGNYDFESIASDIAYNLFINLRTYKDTDITTTVIDYDYNYDLYNGRTAKVAGTNYKISLEKTGFGTDPAGITNLNINSTFKANVLDCLNRDQILDYATRLVDFSTVTPSVGYNVIYYIFSKNYTEIKITLPSDAERQHCYDSGGFDIFCLPYSDLIDFDQSMTSNKFINLSIANAIMSHFSGQTIDLQLLPYCPFINQVSQGSIDTSNLAKTEIKAGANTVGYVFWLSTASFEVNLPYGLSVDESKKVINETKMWRLCSPNYASQFEFNIAKLDDQAGPFTADVTLKPYSPYIRVSPNFSGLYGKDFNDKRGLILSGDFSLPLTSSAWENYELNNKNYQNSFNREIESLELSNKYNLISDIVGATVGAAGTGGTGMMLGSSIKPGAGLTGGLIGAGAGVVTGVTDVLINQQLRNENLDKQKDLFNYQIDNIKAMPSTITKGTPLDINFKLWPLVEEYSASDEEIAELKNFIKYRSMTANIVDTLQNVYNYDLRQEFIDYDYYYIEASPINLDGIGSYEITNYLATELNNGFYLRNQRGQV